MGKCLNLWILMMKHSKYFLKLFLIVSEVPELYRKLRAACSKNFRQVSSKSASLTPSYFQIRLIYPEPSVWVVLFGRLQGCFGKSLPYVLNSFRCIPRTDFRSDILVRIYVCMNVWMYVYIYIYIFVVVNDHHCCSMFSMFSMQFNDVSILFNAVQWFCIAFYYTKADLNETWGKVYIQVSRSFLCSSCSPSNCPRSTQQSGTSRTVEPVWDVRAHDDRQTSNNYVERTCLAVEPGG